MTSIIITLLIVLYRIPLINILGDKGMGYYSIALVIYLLLMTCIAYGLPEAVSKLIATQSSKGHYGLVYKTTGSALIFASVFGGMTALLVFLGSDIIAVHLMNAANSRLVLCAFAPCIFFISILGALHGIFNGTRKITISKTAHNIEKFFVAIFSIAGAWIFTNIGKDIAEPAYGAMGAALGLTVGVFIACLFSGILFLKQRKKLQKLAQKEKSKEKKRDIILTLMYSMFPLVLTLIVFHLSTLLDYAIFNRMMYVQGHKESSYIILLGMLNGKYEFFISLPLLLVNWYAMSKTPVIAKIISNNNNRKTHIKITQCLRYLMLCIIPWTAIYILYSKPLMNLFFTGNNDTASILLKIGAVSVVFYSLTAISNAVLTALDDRISVTRNAFIALVIQVISLLIMLIIFQWGIVAVVVSRIIFSCGFFILNEHVLRERTGYVQEQKRTFKIPITATLIMSTVSGIVYIIFKLFLTDKVAVIIALVVGIPVYIMALIFLGGITQREMYRIPGGRYLAPLCRKLHLIR